MPTTRALWAGWALAPLAIMTTAGSALADVAEDDPNDPLVWMENCPAQATRGQLMYCRSRRLVPQSYAKAAALSRLTAPPDAGLGVDASSVIGACDGTIGGGGGGTKKGLGPADFAAAYNIPATPTGAGKIVAIVDACADTTVLSDLAAYRAGYGLPALPECGGADGNAPTPGGAPCIGVMSQRGDGALPTPDSGWAGEIALDVEMVSAVCPQCSILLIEADSPNSWDLGPAVDKAVALGASAVSNSYGAQEDPSDQFGTAFSDGPYADHYRHAGVLVTVASGDDGYNNQGLGGTLAPSFPSTIPEVLSVGGTTLSGTGATRTGYKEVMWGGSTSGCSGEFARPGYQTSVATGSCTMRADTDVSAAASNVSTYSAGGWGRVGGTSCASPLVAALMTRVGVEGRGVGFFYANTSAFNDITSGNNDPSHSCTDVMCNTGVGWDGPTGWGSPNGALLAMAGATDAGGADDAGGGDDASPSGDDGGGTDAMVGADAGGTPDAGPIDTGDAAPAPTGQADAAPDDAGPLGNGNGSSGSGSSGGCGCGVVGSSPEGALGVAAMLAGAALVLARRRRRG